jgi:pimeloyl-ACP methyl ester carboxylesterase
MVSALREALPPWQVGRPLAPQFCYNRSQTMFDNVFSPIRVASDFLYHRGDTATFQLRLSETRDQPMSSASHPESRDVEIAGSCMNVMDVGQGEAVMLGHSFLWNAEMWRPQIDALSRRYRVIVPELWGHGASSPLPTDTRSNKDLAFQHLALLDALSVDRCAIVGLSVGGMWGAELALIAPNRLSALVLMDTSLAAEPEETRQHYFAMMDAVANIGAIPDAVREAVVPLFFSPGARDRVPELVDAFDTSLRSWDSARLTNSVVPLGRIIFGRRDATAELAAIGVPTLIMTGEHDMARPVREGLVMAETLGCRFVAIPKAGHISNLEAPEYVNHVLIEFLDSIIR